jgi:hypothetical protein
LKQSDLIFHQIAIAASNCKNPFTCSTRLKRLVLKDDPAINMFVRVRIHLLAQQD